MLKIMFPVKIIFLLLCFSVQNFCWAEEVRQQEHSQIISGIVQGPLRLVSNAALSGIANGLITVGSGATLYLSGIANGVIIEAGGRAIVSGVVKGGIINNGGYVQVSGIVDSIHTNLGGTTRIIRGAFVNGVRQ